MEKFIRGTLKGLLHIQQDRFGTIPILAKLMKIPQDVAAKIYDLVLPGNDGRDYQPKVAKRGTPICFEDSGAQTAFRDGQNLRLYLRKKDRRRA
jgi:hypothetical protein